ncbi:MAG: hypothetical protein WKF57_17255 [Nakamurella sp.]
MNVIRTTATAAVTGAAALALGVSFLGATPAAAAPAAAIGHAPAPPAAGCEATSLTIVNDTEGTEFGSLDFNGKSVTFPAYRLTLTTAGSNEAFDNATVRAGDSFNTGPAGPGQYNLTAVPVEQSGAENLGLIYSGSITLSCTLNDTASLTEFLGNHTPVAEDEGVTEAEQAAGSPIPVPTRIETGAGGAAALLSGQPALRSLYRMQAC